MLGHIKHLQSLVDCDFQLTNHHAKMQNNWYVPFFFYFIKSTSSQPRPQSNLRGCTSSVLLLSENSQRFSNSYCISFSSIFANSSSVVRRMHFVWRVSRFFRISSKRNFRPDMGTCCVILLPSLIAVLVKIFGTTIWPRLYSICSILNLLDILSLVHMHDIIPTHWSSKYFNIIYFMLILCIY